MEGGAKLVGVEQNLESSVGIRQVTVAGHACTIGVLTPACFHDNDDVDWFIMCRYIPTALARLFSVIFKTSLFPFRDHSI